MNASLPTAAAQHSKAQHEVTGPADHGQWQAELSLRFEQNARGTRLAHSHHKGPLYIQKPFYPEGDSLAHVYLLHPPGGIVSGDVLTINLDVGENAGLLCTTPGAARFYGARQELLHKGSDKALSALQTQNQRFSVAEGASLEWLPMETIIYNLAQAQILTEINLAANSSYIGWEFSCLGLLGRGQAFTQGSFSQRTRVFREAKPVLVDRLAMQDGNLDLLKSPAGLSSQRVMGTFFAVPSLQQLHSKTFSLDTLVEQCREVLERMAESSVDGPDSAYQNSADKVALTALPEYITARYLGDSANEGRALFTALWQVLRPALIERQSCSPRIWAT